MKTNKANYKNIGYSLCNELPKDDDRQELWEQQRTERGFDSTELWNLDVTIAKFIVPRLQAAKESYGIDEDIINKIIFAFEYASSEKLFSGPITKEVTEGLQLFSENYFALWN